MFRSASPYRVAGVNERNTLGGMNARAAMVNGGLIDGLAELSQAFIQAPIARRKNELAAKKLQADADYRAQTLEKGSTIRPEQVGRIAVDLHETARKAATDPYGKVDAKAWRENYRRLRMLQPQAVRDMLPEDNASEIEQAGGNVGGSDTGDIRPAPPAGQPSEDIAQGFVTMRRSGAPGGAQTLGDVLGGRWYGSGDGSPQPEEDNLANQFSGDSLHTLSADEIEAHHGPLEEGFENNPPAPSVPMPVSPQQDPDADVLSTLSGKEQNDFKAILNSGDPRRIGIARQRLADRRKQ